MAKMKTKLIEIVGALVGVAFYCMFVFVIFIFGPDLLIKDYINEWLVVGILPFIIIGSHYIVAGSAIDETKRKDDEISIKSSAIGFVLWLIVAVVLFVTKAVMKYNIFSTGGYIVMLAIYLHLRRKLPESEKTKEFPIMYSFIIALAVFYIF